MEEKDKVMGEVEKLESELKKLKHVSGVETTRVEPPKPVPISSAFIQWDADNWLEIPDVVSVKYHPEQYAIETKTHLVVLPHTYKSISFTKKVKDERMDSPSDDSE